VLSLSSISECTDNTSSANNIFKDLSDTHMSTLSDNEENSKRKKSFVDNSRKNIQRVTVRRELESEETRNRAKMGYRSTSPAVNINIAELH